MKRITVIIFASLFILLKGYSQTIEVYEDSRETGMRLLIRKICRNKGSEIKVLSFYNNIQLYEYTPTGQDTNLLPIVRATLVYTEQDYPAYR